MSDLTSYLSFKVNDLKVKVIVMLFKTISLTAIVCIDRIKSYWEWCIGNLNIMFLCTFAVQIRSNFQKMSFIIKSTLKPLTLFVLATLTDI